MFSYRISILPRLVTGTSTGFGRLVTERLLKLGHTVVATLRTPSVLDGLVSAHPASRLLALRCDVTKNSDILSSFAEAKRAFGRVDVVFSNAGYGVGGEVESCPEKDVRALFDVNFWDAVNVNREAIRFFREDNPPDAGKVLLVNSSVLGIEPGPITGYYNAS